MSSESNFVRSVVALIPFGFSPAQSRNQEVRCYQLLRIKYAYYTISIQWIMMCDGDKTNFPVQVLVPVGSSTGRESNESSRDDRASDSVKITLTAFDLVNGKQSNNLITA